METMHDERLPKAKLVWAQWHWWWFTHRGYWKWKHFWMTTRGANYWQGWLGPLTFGWRRPWIRYVAEQHLELHYGEQRKVPNAKLSRGGTGHD